MRLACERLNSGETPVYACKETCGSVFYCAYSCAIQPAHQQLANFQVCLDINLLNVHVFAVRKYQF